ncbi:TPA: hypothetical protein N3X57_004284 [Klebsiella quasipneumoniae]|nr:hypothetical protein [Klebsiella quasipneumoniae]
MTKSTITDKRVTSVIERLEHYACNLKWTNVRGAQDLLAAADGLRELQERRKAAMDSKPVILYRQINPANGMKTYWAELDQEEFRHLKKYTDENAEFMTLYRHAQPAPAVPDELLKEYLRLVQCMLSDYRDSNYGNAQRWIRHIAKASDDFERKHGISPWEMARKTCRAAMLAAAPQEVKGE